MAAILNPCGRHQPVPVEFTAQLFGNTSAKEKQLEDAKRRSHAATVGWRKAGRTRRRRDAVKHDQHQSSRPRAHPPLLDMTPARSSDPFDALPMKVTPEINRVISFLRDVSNPALYSGPFFSRCVFSEWNPQHQFSPQQDLKELVAESWALIGSAIQDHGSFLAVVTNEAVVLTKITSSSESSRIKLLGLQTQARCIASVREQANRLMKGNEIPNAFLKQVLYLYCAACRANDRKSAIVHGCMLRQLLSKVVPDRNRTFALLLSCCLTADLASSTLTRPIMDFKTWYPAMFGAMWNATSFLLPPTPAECENLHPCIVEPRLRRICIRQRRFQAIAEYFHATDERPPIGMVPVYSYVASSSMVDLGALCELYQDVKVDEGNLSDDFRSDLDHVHAAVILTSLHVIRDFIHVQNIDNFNVRDASPVIMPRLSSTVQSVAKECLLVESKWHMYEECLLWILFQGSLYERRLQRRDSNFNLGFGDLLEVCVNKSGLTTWEDMLKILRRFLYVEFTEPNAGVWFETIVSRAPAVCTADQSH